MIMSGEDPMTPPPEAHHIVVPGGEAFIWLPHPGIAAQKARGVLSLAMAEAFGAFYRALSRPGAHVRVFDDYEELTTYTRDAREFTTAFTLEFLSSLRGLHILHGSKHLALGISSFKHRIGDELVHTYTDRESFLRSYDAAVADAPRLGWS
jgi:hypothetical protein